MTKYHPVLFNAAMVRAILSGNKTQTRRPMKPQPVVDDPDERAREVYRAARAYLHWRGNPQ